MPLAIESTGLVTSVGLSAPTACAAIRARISNPSETHFIDSSGERIFAHQVSLEQPWRDRKRLVKMAAMAITECLATVPRADWKEVPLLLCIAERERPGRPAGLDDELFTEIEREVGTEFAAARSLIVPHGRVSIGVALQHARRLIEEQGVAKVLIAAADSLLSWPTLGAYERDSRLLTARNSNGFMPGEGAAALLVSSGAQRPQLMCTGIGFSMESSHIESGEPLRADGLGKAIRNALLEAACEIHDLDFRVTDISGEQYYFKEAALALSRILRVRKEEFDIWHPAESIGETGAVAGLASIVVVDAACRKGYAPGSRVLLHAANDAGQRAAAIMSFAGR